MKVSFANFDPEILEPVSIAVGFGIGVATTAEMVAVANHHALPIPMSLICGTMATMASTGFVGCLGGIVPAAIKKEIRNSDAGKLGMGLPAAALLYAISVGTFADWVGWL